MHFHHKHDIDGCTTDHAGDWPDWAVALLATLDRMELIRMTAEQDAIAALAARIDAAEARIAAKLTAPAPEPVDLSPLAAVADKLDALVPADPAPAEPAPVDTTVIPAQSIPSVPLA